MKAGPKALPTAPPIDLSHLPKHRGTRACAFIRQYLTVPKGVGALRPVVLRPWQKEIVHGALAPGIRQGLVSMPRGNAKTTLAAFLATHAFFDGPPGARVYFVASDERQARFGWDTCRRMIELNPVLADQVQFFADGIRIPHSDALLAPLPASPRALQGTDPTFVVVDEVAQVEDGTWEAMSLASGKRRRSLILGISTAPEREDSCMYRLRELGLAGDDPHFYFWERCAPTGADPHDEANWEIANPALDDFLSREALRSTLKTTRIESFMRYRLNMCVADSGTWLPWGLWEGLSAPRAIPAGSRVVLGFDGSVSGDSTALVLATVEERPHVSVIGLWEKPDGATGWRVPRQEVTAALDACYARYDVAETACDPAYWRDTIEQWALSYKGIVEVPTHSVARMGPATDRVYAAISEERLSHDGDERLARHVGNCVVRQTMAGAVVQKNHKDSPRRIDAAIAMILAVDRALWHHHQAPKRRRVFVGDYS